MSNSAIACMYIKEVCSIKRDSKFDRVIRDQTRRSLNNRIHSDVDCARQARVMLRDEYQLQLSYGN